MHAICTSDSLALESDLEAMGGHLHAILEALYLALPGASGVRAAAVLQMGGSSRIAPGVRCAARRRAFPCYFTKCVVTERATNLTVKTTCVPERCMASICTPLGA